MRIELGFEQLNQQPSHVRIAAEGLFHVSLRKRDTGLQQVFAIGTQYADLTPVELRQQHQAIEAIVFGIAAPDPFKGLLE